MVEHRALEGQLLEEAWLTLEEVAAACRVEPAWLSARFEEGYFPQATSLRGLWRLAGPSLERARRMRQLERDFDCVPEMAALVADLLEEMDSLRARLRRAGLA